MKRNPWMAIFVLVLFVIPADTRAAVPPDRNENCPPDPESGWIYCQSKCEGNGLCASDQTTPSTSYCWAVALVSGHPAYSCHSGEYDPCCDPNYQW